MVMDLVQTSVRLMDECTATIKRFEENYKDTGQKYNIFKITGISTDEVKTCKVLTDLLNPNGMHYRGDVFLRSFIDMMNKKMPTPLTINMSKARVKNEYSTDINRRIDIVIEDGTIFIPIEVKIYAGDQEEQVSHYAEFSRFKNRNKSIPVIYLTIDGKPPSNANEGEFVPISFRYDIIKWLNNCLRNPAVERAKPVLEVLKQLILSIKSICGISEDEKMEKAIETLVTQSENTVKAAIAIKQAVESFEERLGELFKTKIFDNIQKYISDAKCDEYAGWWYYIGLPIRNGKYILSINYNWRRMGIEVSETNKKPNKEEKEALDNKMTELTGIGSEKSNYYVWVNQKFSYPRFSNVDDGDLYYYKLYKEYLENTSEAVNMIVNIVNELNKA